MLGVRPGAGSPLTVINDSDHKGVLVLDSAFQTEDRIYAQPLGNEMTMGITGAGREEV